MRKWMAVGAAAVILAVPLGVHALTTQTTSKLDRQTGLVLNSLRTTTSVSLVDIPGLSGLSACAVNQVTGTVSVQVTGPSVGIQVQVDNSAVLDPGSIRFIPAGAKAAFSFSFVGEMAAGEHVFDVQWSSPTGNLVSLLRGTLNLQYEEGTCT
jgi:hypothetical protein